MLLYKHRGSSRPWGTLQIWLRSSNKGREWILTLEHTKKKLTSKVCNSQIFCRRTRLLKVMLRCIIFGPIFPVTKRCTLIQWHTFCNICFVHPIFRFWFLVTFGNEVTKIWKYYIIFVYILQGKMGKPEKNGKKIKQLKWPKYQKPKDKNMGWMKHKWTVICSMYIINPASCCLPGLIRATKLSQLW